MVQLVLEVCSADDTIATDVSISKKNLFEVNTLASIRKNGISTDALPISSLLKDNTFILAVEKCLWIFKDVGNIETKFSLEFDANIDKFVVCENFLLLVLSSGHVKVVNFDEGIIVATGCLQQNIRFDKQMFYALFEYGSKDCIKRFISVDKSGIIYEITMDTSNENLTVSVNQLTDLHMEVKLATNCHNKMFLYGSTITILDLDSMHIDAFSSKLKFLKIYKYRNNYFIALREDGQLCMICATTLCIKPIKQLPKDISDFVARDDFICYLEKNESICKMISCPGLEEKFSLAIENITHLVPNYHFVDRQIFISDCNDRLCVSSIDKVKPEQHLQYLLRKSKYEEAELFAKKFNLDADCIKKARVENIVKYTTCGNAEVEQLINLMQEIKDIKFNIENCLHVKSNSFENVFKLLNFASTLISSKDAESEDNALFSSVFNALRKLHIFINIESTLDSSVPFIEKFARYNLLKCFNNYFYKQNYNAALQVFTGMEKCDLKRENLAEILKDMSALELDQMKMFLNEVIPKFLSYFPDCFSEIKNWVVDQVFAFEVKRTKIDFPETALDFLHNVMLIFKVCQINEIEIFDEIIKSMEAMQTLRNNFNIHLPLENFLEGAGAVLGFFLKRNITKPLLQNFLIPFIAENDLNVDLVFEEEIKKCVLLEESQWTKIVPLIWNCIESVEIRLNCLRTVMKAASKPWSSEIRAMIDTALTFTHTLVSTIEAELEKETKYVVLQNYGVLFEDIDIIEVDEYVIKKIISANQEAEAIRDIFILCSSHSSRFTASLLLLEEFIYNGRIGDFYVLIKELSSTEVLDNVFSYFEFCNNIYDILEDEEIDNLLTAVTIISNKALESSDELQKIFIETELNQFKRLNIVLKLCGIKFTFDEAADEKRLIEFIVKEWCDKCESIDFQHLLRDVILITEAFDTTVEDLLLEFCSVSRDIKLMDKTATYFSANCTKIRNSRTLSRLAVLILRSVRSKEVDLSNTLLNSTLINQQVEEIDTKLMNKCLAAANRLCAKALLQEDNPCEVLEIFNWTQVAMELFAHSKQKYCLFTNSFTIASKHDNLSTINAFCKTFNMFCNFMITENKFRQNQLILSCYLEHDPTSEQQFLNSIPSALEDICSENNYTLAKRLLDVLLTSCVFSDESKNTLFTYSLKCKKLLVPKILAQKQPDFEMASKLLLGLGANPAMQRVIDEMNVCKNNLEKLEQLAQLGCDVAKFYSCKERFSQILTRIKWLKEIPKPHTLTYSDVAMCDPKEALDKIISRGSVTVEMIKGYCKEYRLEEQNHYLSYLKMLIQNWYPKYTIELVAGKKTLQLKQNEEQELIAKCMQVVELIKSRNAVLECVNSLWNKINFYLYEVFTAILHVAAALNEVTLLNYRFVLRFFKGYKRLSKPSSYERTEWFTRSRRLELDPLSEFRIPFFNGLFSKDFQNILRAEFNLKNYQDWFYVTPFMKNYLSNDDICSYVVRDAIAAISGTEDINNEKWNIYPKFTGLFDQIDACLSQIENRLMAASVAYDMISHIPNGADKVIATKLALKYASKHSETEDVNASGDCSLFRVLETHNNYITNFILHSNKLADEKYTSLVSSPKELIGKLYTDERIINADEQCPEINKAVDEIAKLHNIDLEMKRNELLEQWLNQNIESDLFDFGHSSSDTKDIYDNSRDGILRSAYLCRSDLQHFGPYIYNKSKTEKNNLVRARSLQVYVLIMPAMDAEDKSKASLTSYMLLSKKLYLLHNIGLLGYTLSLDQLEGIPKEKLLRKLSANREDRSTVKVMACICDIYKIFVMQYWELIMNTMMEMEMIEELKYCLKIFAQNDVKVLHSFYTSAWEITINDTISKVLRSKLDPKTYIKILVYLQYCPILWKVDLCKSQEMCFNMKEFALATFFLQYVSADERKKRLENILHYVSGEKLRELIESLEKCGFVVNKKILELIC